MKKLEIEVELTKNVKVEIVKEFLQRNFKSIYTNQIIHGVSIDGIVKIRIGECSGIFNLENGLKDSPRTLQDSGSLIDFDLNEQDVENELVELSDCELEIHLFVQNYSDLSILPNNQFEGLWEKLYYDEPIKQQLMDYAKTSLLFSMKGVDPNIVSINRVVLLHGPPGS